MNFLGITSFLQCMYKYIFFFQVLGFNFLLFLISGFLAWEMWSPNNLSAAYDTRRVHFNFPNFGLTPLNPLLGHAHLCCRQTTDATPVLNMSCNLTMAEWWLFSWLNVFCLRKSMETRAEWGWVLPCLTTWSWGWSTNRGATCWRGTSYLYTAAVTRWRKACRGVLWWRLNPPHTIRLFPIGRLAGHSN